MMQPDCKRQWQFASILPYRDLNRTTPAGGRHQQASVRMPLPAAGLDVLARQKRMEQGKAEPFTGLCLQCTVYFDTATHILVFQTHKHVKFGP